MGWCWQYREKPQAVREYSPFIFHRRQPSLLAASLTAAFEDNIFKFLFAMPKLFLKQIFISFSQFFFLTLSPESCRESSAGERGEAASAARISVSADASAFSVSSRMSRLHALVRCCAPNGAIPKARERDPILQGSHLISGVNQHLIS